MNILRAAVIMASTSREKSSKESLSMPSSQTRGMLAACFIMMRENKEEEWEHEPTEQEWRGRSVEAVPFLDDDTWKWEDMLIRTLRPRLQGGEINEGALLQDFFVVYLQSPLMNAVVQQWRSTGFLWFKERYICTHSFWSMSPILMLVTVYKMSISSF